MPNDMPAGLTRVETLQVVHDNGNDKTYIAFYLDEENGRMSVLIDSFRNWAWTSTYLPPEVAGILRQGLNRTHRRRLG